MDDSSETKGKNPVRPFLLTGEYGLTLDEKNRLLIPSDIRKSWDIERDGNAFYLLIGVNSKPWLYAERTYERLVEKRESELAPGEDMLAFDHKNFSMASKVEWDKQGRILIPEKMIQRTKTSRDITLLGTRNHLEIWNQADWDIEAEKLLKL